MAEPEIVLTPRTCKVRFIQLSEVEVRALYWRRLLSTTEIADHLGISNTAVSDQFKRIYSTLIPELSIEKRKPEGEKYLEKYYFPLLKKYLTNPDEINNWLDKKIAIQKELDEEDIVEEATEEKVGEKPEEKPDESQQSQVPVNKNNFSEMFTAAYERTASEEENRVSTENTNVTSDKNGQDSDEDGKQTAKEDTSRSLQDLAKDRRYQILAAVLVIFLGLGCCVLVIIGIQVSRNGIPEIIIRNTPTASPPPTSTPPPAVTSTSTPTITLTPSITTTSTFTQTSTPSPIPTNTWTPPPTEELVVNTRFGDTISPWDISGEYTVIDGGMTALDYARPISLSVGDSSWKNYKITVSFKRFSDGLCPLDIGVRINDDGKGMWLGRGFASRLMWKKGDRATGDWIPGTENLVPIGPATATIKVTGNQFAWLEGSSISVEGYPTGGVRIYLSCDQIDYIKIVRLP